MRKFAPIFLFWCLTATAMEVGDRIRFCGGGGIREVTVACRPSRSSWLGSLDGYGESLNATIVESQDGWRMEVDDWLDRKIWTVVSSPDGMDVAVREKTRRVREPCRTKKATSRRSLLAKRARLVKQANVVMPGITDDWTFDPVTNEIDVLVVFDTTAISWLNSQRRMAEEFAAAQVAKMNVALANSGLAGDFSVALCGTFNADFSITKDCGRNRYETLSVALDYVTGSRLDAWAAIRDERERLGADVVVILANSQPSVRNISDIGGTVGISFGLEYDAPNGLFGFDKDYVDDYREAAYAACDVRVVAEDNTFGHEVGHLMGAGHSDLLDPYYSNPGPQLFPYSAALMYQDPVDSGYYYTIMGYNSVDGRWDSPDYMEVPYYSSPEVSHPVTGSALGDEAHDNVRSLRESYAVISQYRVRPSVEPEPEPEPEPAPEPAPIIEEISGTIADVKFTRLQEVKGALYDADGRLVGTVLLKFGKMGSKGTVKVSAAATMMDGKKISSRSRKFERQDGRMRGWIDFKAPILSMDFAEGTNGTFTLKNAAYSMKEASVGGVLAAKSLLFNAAMDSVPDFAAAGKLLVEALPTNVHIAVVNGTKWQCGKAPSLKYRKDRETGTYKLDGLGDPSKPNVSGLRLSYAWKTGIYKGSFKLYTTTADTTPPNRAPKLKKHTVNVFGFMIDAAGEGRGTLKRPAASWRTWVK